MEPNFEKSEVLAIAIQEEWQNFRYQDGLSWSKIQTIAVIEGAYIAAVYSAPKDVSLCALVFFAILVSLVVLAICGLAEKDGRDATYHMLRAEKLLAIKKETDVPLPLRVFGLSGRHTMRIAMILVNLLNLAVIVEIVSRCRCT